MDDEIEIAGGTTLAMFLAGKRTDALRPRGEKNKRSGGRMATKIGVMKRLRNV